MRTKIVAVTVGEHYYLRGTFCVKYLGIGRRLDGTPFWHVKRSECKHLKLIDAINAASTYNRDYVIPYFQDVKHGQVVTRKQATLLKTYGFTV